MLLPSLVGATGSAKTRLACLVAERIAIEVLGADSRQIYRGFDIGTAKPNSSEREAVPHHLVDFVDPRDTFSAARFGVEARRVAGEVWARGAIPLLVGGSGLYVRAAERGLFAGPPADEGLRARWTSHAREVGANALHKELQRVDPETARRVAARDVVRIVRALEVHELTGRPLSAHHAAHRSQAPLARSLRFGIRWSPATLLRRIEARANQMLASGWEDEVRALLGDDLREDAPAWDALGYAEVRALVQGTIGRQEAILRIVQATRRFVKRQGTWFRADSSTTWFDVSTEDELPRVAERIALRLGEVAREATS